MDLAKEARQVWRLLRERDPDKRGPIRATVTLRTDDDYVEYPIVIPHMDECTRVEFSWDADKNARITFWANVE